MLRRLRRLRLRLRRLLLLLLLLMQQLLCAGDWCAQHFLKKLLRHKALLHLLLPAATNAQRCGGAPALKLPAWHRGEKRHHLASKDGELARLFARKVKEHARKAGRPL